MECPFKAGQLIKSKNGKGYCLSLTDCDAAGTQYRILAVGDMGILLSRPAGMDLETAYNSYSQYGILREHWNQLKHGLPNIKVAGLYWHSWNEFEIVSNDTKLVEKLIPTQSLSEQAKKNRAFFFKDLESEYIAPCRENGERVSGLKYL